MPCSLLSALYGELCEVEAGHANRKDGLEAGVAALKEKLAARGLDYDRFCFSHLETRRAA